MSILVDVLGVLLMISLGVVALSFLLRSTEASRKLQDARSELDACQQRGAALQQRSAVLQQEIEALRQEGGALQLEVAAQQQEIEGLRVEKVASAENIEQHKIWLDNQHADISWLRCELEKRPKITRKIYKILTLGVSSTGKTSLTLKWANPLVDLGMIQGTKVERYERTVSQVVHKEGTTEHVFEIGDWGGERIVDAQQALIVDEIHGMLIVVDLGGKDAKVVDPARIQDQLLEFQPQALQYFFGPAASCKSVVLFINKSDLLSGTPSEVEAQAKSLYGKLIKDLGRYASQVHVQVLVGSATSGHSTHHLFSHFVEKILPKSAYDNQLLQRMKVESTPPAPSPPLPLASQTAPLAQAAPPPLPRVAPPPPPRAPALAKDRTS
jgi:GTPase SAR1 family protein